jgi:WD40 repeat protein
VQLLDLATGKVTARIPGPRWTRESALSPDGKLFAVREYKTKEDLIKEKADPPVRIWVYDLTSKKRVARITPHPDTPGSCVDRCLFAFSPDSKSLVAVDNGTVEVAVFSIPQGKELARVLPARRSTVFYLVGGMPNEKWLVLSEGSNAGFTLLEVKTARLVSPPAFVVFWPNCLALSRDGKTLALGKQEIRLWQLRLGRE